MTRRLLLFVCAALLCTAAAAAQTLDRNAFTFADYRLELRLLPDQQSLDVAGRIVARNDSATPQKVLPLQVSSSFEWLAIRSEGRPLEFIAQDYQTDLDRTGAVREALVTLPAPLPPGASVTLDVHYAGFAGYDASMLVSQGADESSAAKTLWDQVGDAFTVFRGLGYFTWYPVSLDEQSLQDGDSLFRALARWRARHLQTTLTLINAPRLAPEGDSHARQFVVSNAAQDAACLRSPTCPLVFHPGAATPILALGDYEATRLPDVVVYAGADETQRARRYAEAVERDVKLLAPWLGAPQTPLQIVSLGDDPLQPYDAGGLLATPLRKRTDNELDSEMARSLANLSFRTERPWLREAVDGLAQSLIHESQGGRGYMLGELNRFIDALSFVETPRSDAAQSSSKSLRARSLIDGYDPVLLHAKGSFVLQMLRDMIGDAALKQTLSAYKAADDVAPEYFEHLAERFAKRDLSEFFADWVYNDRGMAQLRILNAYPHQNTSIKHDTQPSWTVTVTVANDGDAWVETPVVVRYAGGEHSERVVVEPHKQAVVRVVSAAAPIEAIVNDGSIPESSVAGHVIKFEVKSGDAD